MSSYCFMASEPTSDTEGRREERQRKTECCIAETHCQIAKERCVCVCGRVFEGEEFW